MAHAYSKLGLITSSLLATAGGWSPAVGQTTTEEAKAQADLRSAQLANAKAVQDMIAANKQATEGKATLENIETGAEGLRLKHVVEQQLAAKLAAAIGDGGGQSLTVVYGAAPPTTAHYLSIQHFREELKENTAEALGRAKKYYDKPKPVRHRPGGPTIHAVSAIGPGLALTGISTIASLLRVDTDLKGAALTLAAESLGPIVADRLSKYNWVVRAPNGIATDTPFANELVAELRPGRDEAAHYYEKYLSDLTAKGGKMEELPEDERIIGAALAIVINDYATLVDGLFTPVEGVLPATVLEQEKALATATGGEKVLFVQGQEAGLTSITKKGFLTGIGNVPAWVSASSNASYVFVGDATPKFGSVSYQTPVLRVTKVQEWADGAEIDYAAWAGVSERAAAKR